MIQRHFVAVLLILTGPTIVPAAEKSDETAAMRSAVERGLKLVSGAASRYPDHRECFSCHHQTIPMLAMVSCLDAKLTDSRTALEDATDHTREFVDRHLEAFKSGGRIGGRSLTASYALWTLDIAGAEPDKLTEALVSWLLKRQEKDGHWHRAGFRPPMSESNVTPTVLAAYGIQEFATNAQQEQADAAIEKTRKWLLGIKPKFHEDRVFALWGADLLGMEKTYTTAARKSVLDAQREDGGWGQKPGMTSDAYATGQTLYVLKKTGTPVGDGAFQRGVQYLLKTQHEDGSWFVKTRAKPVQKYFDNGDPYGKDQFISTPATAWATAALAEALGAEKEEEAKNANVMLLWPDGAPGAKGDKPADKPTLTLYKPEKANGAAVVVCPGGGYGHLAKDHEGVQVAEWLNSLGVTAFVLHYRIAPYQHPAPLQDAQHAIRTVRARAKEWGVDPARIGIMGFSAGGHLSSTAATHFDDGAADAKIAILRAGCRPDFAILAYPVITFTGPFAHKGSRRNLLGDKPDPALAENLSNDKQVTAQTPPTFLMHTTGDRGVPAENSILFYLALKKAGVPAELHIYEQGRHGLGLAQKVPALSSWPKRCADWMRGRGLFEKTSGVK